MDTASTIFDPNTAFQQLLHKLNRFRMTGALCNAILATSDGAAFRVHKLVLSLSSSYFRIMFTTSLKNKDSGDDSPYFLIPDVSSSTLKSIINFAYSGIADVNKGNVNELLPAADQFNVSGLVEECMNFMIKNMTQENCIGIWLFGREYFMPKLEKEAKRFILHRFVDVSMNSEEFLHLKLNFFKNILKDDALNTPNEVFAWIAIKRWCQYEYETRQHFIPCLLSCVRLALLPIKDFQSVMDDPRVFANLECRQHIKMVSKYILNELEDASEMAQDKKDLFMFTPRYPHKMILVMGGCTVVGPSDVFEAYDCRADVWKMIIVKKVTPRFHHQIVTLDKYIYYIGGKFDGDIFNSCFRFDMSSFNLERISAMRDRRSFLSATVLNSKIYAIGGFDGYDRLRTVEHYDSTQNQWTYVSSMNEKRSDASASSLRNRIFVVGGFDGNIFLQSAECYYADFDQWFLLPFMIKCRSGLGCVAMDDCIYAIGGFDSESRLNTVEKYSLHDRQWFPIKPMKTQRSNFAVAILEGKIYVMGGFNIDISDQCECYDPKKLQWQSVAPMRIGRTAFSACTFSPQDIIPFIRDEGCRCLLKNASKNGSTKLFAT